MRNIDIYRLTQLLPSYRKKEISKMSNLNPGDYSRITRGLVCKKSNEVLQNTIAVLKKHAEDVNKELKNING